MTTSSSLVDFEDRRPAWPSLWHIKWDACKNASGKVLKAFCSLVVSTFLQVFFSSLPPFDAPSPCFSLSCFKPLQTSLEQVGRIPPPPLNSSVSISIPDGLTSSRIACLVHCLSGSYCLSNPFRARASSVSVASSHSPLNPSLPSPPWSPLVNERLSPLCRAQFALTTCGKALPPLSSSACPPYLYSPCPFHPGYTFEIPPVWHWPSWQCSALSRETHSILSPSTWFCEYRYIFHIASLGLFWLVYFCISYSISCYFYFYFFLYLVAPIRGEASQISIKRPKEKKRWRENTPHFFSSLGPPYPDGPGISRVGHPVEKRHLRPTAHPSYSLVPAGTERIVSLWRQFAGQPPHQRPNCLSSIPRTPEVGGATYLIRAPWRGSSGPVVEDLQTKLIWNDCERKGEKKKKPNNPTEQKDRK